MGEHLSNLPSTGRLFERYNADLSRRVPPRLVAVHEPSRGSAPGSDDGGASSGAAVGGAGGASGGVVVVTNEGTSVLVRELDKTHARHKAAASHKRSAQARGADPRKQARRPQQAHVQGTAGVALAMPEQQQALQQAQQQQAPPPHQQQQQQQQAQQR